MLTTLRSIVQQVNAAGDLSHIFEIIVNQVCEATESDICSIYLLNQAQDALTLVASRGLNQALMSKAQLSLDQGIVGHVYRKGEFLNTDDASSHPAFHYLKGSGEEGAKAFLGVPIIHYRDVLGVMVIQRFSKQTYGEDAVSFMITLSAQLSGNIANAEARATMEVSRRKQTTDFLSASAVPGIAIAKGWVITSPDSLSKIPDRQCKDVDTEISLLREALNQARKDFRKMARNLSGNLPKSQLALFEAYQNLLSYNSLGRKVESRIREENIWAPAALRYVIESDVQQFYQFDDPYLKERATDIQDLGRRVLVHMLKETEGKKPYPRNMILVSDNVTPSMIAEVPANRLKGIVSIHGSSTSHSAIIARTMGIPALMGLRDCPVDLLENKQLIIDGYNKQLLVSPGRQLISDYRSRQDKEQQLFGKLTRSKARNVKTKTSDGRLIQLFENPNPYQNSAEQEDIAVDGVGLYRTEYLFMQSDRFPGEQEQQQAYAGILDAYRGKPVVLRTLDIGGDKSLPYFPIEEENPFLGWRGIRICLDHPEIFITQLRAMIKANINRGNLHISLPMISTVAELNRSLELLQQAHKDILSEENLNAKQLPFPKVGVVIEVPSAVYQIRRIVERVDFVSIGSNDLTQYMFAVDRNNNRVSYLYNSLHPATLLAFAEICEAANQRNTPVHICGEIAANPLATLLLVAMGITAFSMNNRSIPKVRQIIRKFTYKDANKVLAKALACETSFEVLTYLREVLKEHDLLQLVDPLEAT